MATRLAIHVSMDGFRILAHVESIKIITRLQTGTLLHGQVRCLMRFYKRTAEAKRVQKDVSIGSTFFMASEQLRQETGNHQNDKAAQ